MGPTPPVCQRRRVRGVDRGRRERGRGQGQGVAVRPPAIASVSVACAVCGGAEESVTMKITEVLDAAAGVPARTPAADKLSPEGRCCRMPAPRYRDSHSASRLQRSRWIGRTRQCRQEENLWSPREGGNGRSDLDAQMAVAVCAVGRVESVTVMVAEAVPTELCGGVPVIAPVEPLIASPPGRPLAL